MTVEENEMNKYFLYALEPAGCRHTAGTKKREPVWRKMGTARRQRGRGENDEGSRIRPQRKKQGKAGTKSGRQERRKGAVKTDLEGEKDEMSKKRGEDREKQWALGTLEGQKTEGGRLLFLPDREGGGRRLFPLPVRRKNGKIR